MKIKPNYVLREVANQNIVVPTGKETLKFNGMINLNNSGKFLWNLLQENKSVDELVEAMLDKYDVTKDVANKDVLDFISILEKHNRYILPSNMLIIYFLCYKSNCWQIKPL